jgi:hypothetical protein
MYLKQLPISMLVVWLLHLVAHAGATGGQLGIGNDREGKEPQSQPEQPQR